MKRPHAGVPARVRIHPLVEDRPAIHDDRLAGDRDIDAEDDDHRDGGAREKSLPAIAGENGEDDQRQDRGRPRHHRRRGRHSAEER